jgi:hypothetical protein
MKEIIIGVANETSVSYNIPKTAVNPTTVDHLILSTEPVRVSYFI